MTFITIDKMRITQKQKKIIIIRCLRMRTRFPDLFWLLLLLLLEEEECSDVFDVISLGCWSEEGSVQFVLFCLFWLWQNMLPYMTNFGFFVRNLFNLCKISLVLLSSKLCCLQHVMHKFLTMSHVFASFTRYPVLVLKCGAAKMTCCKGG